MCVRLQSIVRGVETAFVICLLPKMLGSASNLTGYEEENVLRRPQVTWDKGQEEEDSRIPVFYMERLPT